MPCKSPEQLPFDDSWILSSDEIFYRELFEDPIEPIAFLTLKEQLNMYKLEFERARRKWKECDA